MASIKTSGAVTTQVSQATNHVVQRAITSSCILIGFTVSTGAHFQKAFPNVQQMLQWITTGASADLEITRIEPIATFGG